MRRQTLVIPIALLLAVMAAAGVVLYTMNVKEEATTGGPTPASAASVAARASFARSIPRSSVSRPGTRNTKRSPSRVTTKFRLVIPPSSGSTSRSPDSHPGTERAIVRTST